MIVQQDPVQGVLRRDVVTQADDLGYAAAIAVPYLSLLAFSYESSVREVIVNECPVGVVEPDTESFRP